MSVFSRLPVWVFVFFRMYLCALKSEWKTKPYRLLGESSSSLLVEWLSSSSSSSHWESCTDPAGLIFRGGGVRLRCRLDDDEPTEWGEIFCSTSSRVSEITPGVVQVDEADGLCRPCCWCWWWCSFVRWLSPNVEDDEVEEAIAECVELWLDGTGCCWWSLAWWWWINGWGEMDGLKCSDAGWFFCTDRGGEEGACDLVTVISPFEVAILEMVKERVRQCRS